MADLRGKGSSVTDGDACPGRLVLPSSPAASITGNCPAFPDCSSWMQHEEERERVKNNSDRKREDVAKVEPQIVH